MKTITSLIIGAGLLALQGCAADPSVDQEDVVSNESAVSAGNATLTITSDWGTGYCANVTMTNGLKEATARWQIVLDLKTTTVNNYWSINFSKLTGMATVTPVNYNTYVASGASTSFGFCANAPSASVRPAIKAWNMESNAYATCPTNSGLQPTKASLAVAMARELGRWDPLKDLTVDWSGNTVLSATGLARCTNSCKNVKALLTQQDSAINNVIAQEIFNATVFRSDLASAIDRQRNLIANLTANNKSALPPAHKLTYVAGPTNLGSGNCGPHYVFQVDTETGVPLTSTQATNMKNSLCYFGYGDCGSNPYIAFASVTSGCPSGKTCIAIDPTDGDNSTTSTTTAGSAPTYPLNRVYDPANSLLGTTCITTKGALGTLTSKCATITSSCGYLYCIAN